jgi:glycosyltransferase involved in cell wall biosynthesis
MRKTIIYAPNVGSGGGLVLLRAILKSWPIDHPMIAILDNRARSVLEIKDMKFKSHWAEASFRGRWRVERLLSKITAEHDIVFCFHNIPPLLANRGLVYCYVHNAHIVGLVPSSDLTGWVRVRIAIERFIARHFRHSVDRYVVQTPTMLAALRRELGDAPPIDVMPFLDMEMMPASQARSVPRERPASTEDKPEEPEWDFIYVSDGPAHKNHPVLFEAWRLLGDRGLFPKLALTLNPDRDKVLRDRLGELVEKTGVDIVDLGRLPHAEVLRSYGRARALLFASYSESFGIPLMEAQAAGLPILAAELDFVRDVCEPTVTFDPHSARSIARAVERFLYGASSVVAPMSADVFVERLIDQAGPARPDLTITTTQPVAGS